jgi:hypothetical protein
LLLLGFDALILGKSSKWKIKIAIVINRIL